MTTQAQTIAELLKIRDTSHADLLRMPTALVGSEWARDRMNDITHANRELKRLGALPAQAATG